MTTQCPKCGSQEFTYLGVLGTLTWLRCRQCGSDVRTTERIELKSASTTEDEDDYDEPNPERQGQDRYIAELDEDDDE